MLREHVTHDFYSCPNFEVIDAFQFYWEKMPLEKKSGSPSFVSSIYQWMGGSWNTKSIIRLLKSKSKRHMIYYTPKKKLIIPPPLFIIEVIFNTDKQRTISIHESVQNFWDVLWFNRPTLIHTRSFGHVSPSDYKFASTCIRCTCGNICSASWGCKQGRPH